MWWNRKERQMAEEAARLVQPPKPRSQPKSKIGPKWVRKKNQEWLVKDENFQIEVGLLSVMQDIRDELHDLNKKVTKMDEHFREVFGVDDKQSD